MRVTALVLCLSLAGCATDQQRTKTQGTAIGAASGAGLGAGLGALSAIVTGDRGNIGRNAAIGAGAGLIIGGVFGYQWGKRVAFNKEQYRTSEDRLVANTQQASKALAAAAQENSALRGEIAELQKRIEQLYKDSELGNPRIQERGKLVNSIDKRRQDVKGII